MDWEIAARLAAGIALVLANAFFVTTEFALTRVRQLPRESFEGSPALRRAWQMTERLEIYLTGCQLGITTTSVLLGVLAEPAVTALIEPFLGGMDLPASTRHLIAIVVGVTVINLIHKIWGEQAPTYLGVERPRLVLGALAPALYWWTKVMYPVIIAGDRLAKLSLRPFGVRIRRSWIRGNGDEVGEPGPAELREQMGELLARGGVSRDRRREVLAALEIGSKPVRDIAVPRARIVSLGARADPEENFAILRRGRHSRYPLVGSTVDDFRGIVYVPAVLARYEEMRDGRVGFEDVAHAPMWLAPEDTIAHAIDRFQQETQELALIGKDGRVIGLLTSTDAFESIIGELEDPLDREPESAR